FDRRLQLLHARQHGLVRLHRGVEIDRIALGILDDPEIGEGDLYLAEILRIGSRLHDGDLVAERIVDPGRIRPGRCRIAVRQQRVRMAADDYVDARNFGDRLHVARIADMGERDDLADALAGEFLDRGGYRLDVVGDFDMLARRGQLVGVVGDRADDADLLAANFKHD